METLTQLWEKPSAKEMVMIVGWRQWADAGAISSTLPEYLIEQTNARKIGTIPDNGYYLFQLPATHHLLRPIIKLEDGYRQSMEVRQNNLYFAGSEEKGVVIFLGDEPHLNVEKYAAAFYELVKTLQITRIVAVGGVYGPVPYDKERDISCVYSHPHMKSELEAYAMRFSNYEGGATIGSYLVDRAEREGVPFLALYAFVPAYNFSDNSAVPQGVQVEEDYKAWYDLMRRINRYLGLSLNLSGLEEDALTLMETMETQLTALEEKMPQLNVRDYLDNLNQEFTERPFEALDDVWMDELQDLFNDLDE